MCDEFPENLSQQNFNITEMTWKIYTVELGNKELFGRPKIVP